MTEPFPLYTVQYLSMFLNLWLKPLKISFSKVLFFFTVGFNIHVTKIIRIEGRIWNLDTFFEVPICLNEYENVNFHKGICRLNSKMIFDFKVWTNIFNIYLLKWRPSKPSIKSHVFETHCRTVYSVKQGLNNPFGVKIKEKKSWRFWTDFLSSLEI